MMRWIGLLTVLALIGCAHGATGAASGEPEPVKSRAVEFFGPGGRIKLDLSRLTAEVPSGERSLQDCGDEKYNCFTDGQDFKIQVPKGCKDTFGRWENYRDELDLMFVMPHGDDVALRPADSSQTFYVWGPQNGVDLIFLLAPGEDAEQSLLSGKGFKRRGTAKLFACQH